MYLKHRKRRSLSFTLLKAVRPRSTSPGILINDLLRDLGEKSFGWAMLLFSLINLLPLPPGTTLLTALPLILIAGQMALGFEQLQLPKMIGRREVQRESLRRVVHKMRPISRRIERIIRPRMPWVFYPRNERLIGLWLLLVAFALFLPLPLSGWFPAISLLVSGFGLIERDGLVLVIGAIMGAASILITLLVATTLAIGAEAVI